MFLKIEDVSSLRKKNMYGEVNFHFSLIRLHPEQKNFRHQVDTRIYMRRLYDVYEVS